MPIRFDAELERGLASYEDVLGKWWLRQSRNGAHVRAYRRIARYIHDSFRRPLRRIIDYGCGTGALLSRLAWRYPRTALLGLDGSSFMLELARRRIARQGRACAARVRLLRTPLPSFALPAAEADLAVYAFPNIVPDAPGGSFLADAHRLTPAERYILDSLAGERAACAREDLLRNRLIALDLRSLLKSGGYCVRVEYAAVAPTNCSAPEWRRDPSISPSDATARGRGSAWLPPAGSARRS
jgi:SAM-dependent methyltransferase